jgi:hypothetical protein
MIKSSSLVTGTSLIFSALGFGILTNFPAFAQSSYPSADTATPIEMSKEGMRILCDRSPLNSRCSDTQSGTAPSRNSREEQGQADTTTAPTEDLPSESDVPSSGEGRQEGRRMDLDNPSTQPSGEMTVPSGTTAPTENLPSESPVPSSK